MGQAMRQSYCSFIMVWDRSVLGGGKSTPSPTLDGG
jgi:hypothetical protein